MLSFLNTLKEKNKDDQEAIVALNEIETELNSKKYGLVWEKHEEQVDMMIKDNIPVFTEVKEKEITHDKKQRYNFLLEGDNLHSLKLLEKTHKEKIDVIYIDPPYNLGKKDFSYNDTFVNEDDGYKHSKWLSFMNVRLEIAYQLLSKNGLIAISIDETEYAQLKLLCDDIFGEKNRLITFHIQVRYDNKNLNTKNDWQPIMEYILIYAKNKDVFKANKPTETYSIDKFIYSIEELSKGDTFIANERKVKVFKKGEWKLKKHDTPFTSGLKETWISGSIYSDTGHGSMYKAIVEPRFEIDGAGAVYKIDGLGDDGLGYRYYTNPRSKNGTRGKMYTGIPIIRRQETETGTSVKELPITNLYNLSADFGNIRHEGGTPFNNGKKPVKLIKQLINYHVNKNSTILDFFAGSGTTGHAVMELNKEDGGNRTYILCTNNENNICEEITYKRLTNIQKKLPHNLKYYKTDFIPKSSEELSDLMLKHIVEMVQLEHGVRIDGNEYLIILTDEEADNLEKNISNYPHLKALYVSSNVLLTGSQGELFRNYDLNIIPDYYFSFELREVGKLW
jgi:adenine-specific DNA-methyltransferase